MFTKMIKIQNEIIDSGFISDILLDLSNVSLNQNYSGEGRITFKGRDKINSQNVEISVGISSEFLTQCKISEMEINKGISESDRKYRRCEIYVGLDDYHTISISKDDLVRSYVVGDDKVYIYRIKLPSLFDKFYGNLPENADRVLKQNPYNLDIVSNHLYNNEHEIKLPLYRLYTE